MNAFVKRSFDISLALVTCCLLAPLILVLAVALWLTDGRPVFYVSKRMSTRDRTFRLWKFRTMRIDTQDYGVTGGDKTQRITPLGRVLRRFRLDELPQLWNVLRGDMSFVGPRPPLPRYVAAFPDIYASVLQSRPGITGLATLVFHTHEERLLARCATAQETEETYVRTCVPRKARLDMIYAKKWSFALDLWIIWETLKRVASKSNK